MFDLDDKNKRFFLIKIKYKECETHKKYKIFLLFLSFHPQQNTA